MKTIVILTGAGVSAESGLSTFRDNNGLWCNHRVEDVATPEAFARNPKLVQDFYNMRRAQLKEVQPNAAHIALAKFVAAQKHKVFLITQNVDNLHEQADKIIGNSAEDNPYYTLIHMHGELGKARCSVSDEVFDWEDDITTETRCSCCNLPGRLRPHIVWFGEMPLQMDLIYHALRDCDLFISIGTSGNVYPAAGFVQEVRMNGKGHTVELNMEPSSGHNIFAEKLYGPATQVVPKYLAKIAA
jgi:NAD-dependent deacetylase